MGAHTGSALARQASQETAALCKAAHPTCAVRAERCDASDGVALRSSVIFYYTPAAAGESATVVL